MMRAGMVEWGPPKILFSIKATRTLAKTVTVHGFRSLEIDQRLAAVWEAFIAPQKKVVVSTSFEV